jgi:lysozyme
MDIKQQLIRDEGVVPCAYQDHLGYWTIGVGRLIENEKVVVCLTTKLTIF